jgi:hypothetical protein
MNQSPTEVIDIYPGVLTPITIGSSEVCAHIGVAGRDLSVVLIVRAERCPLVQIYDEYGDPISFPVLPGEAGVYVRHDGSFYAIRYLPPTDED